MCFQVFTGLIHSTNKTRTDVALKTYGKRVSIIPFISADGKTHLIVFVLQGRKTASGDIDFEGTVHQRTRVTRNYPPIFYLATPSGRISGEDWDLIFGKFLAIVKPWIGTREALVYLDNLGSHLTTQSLTNSIDSDITMLFLPPNTTHILQPLDNLAFCEFKRALKISMRHYLSPEGFSTESFTQVMLSLTHTIMLHAFTPKTLEMSFSNTGLFPFDSLKIMQKVEQFLGLYFPFF